MKYKFIICLYGWLMLTVMGVYAENTSSEKGDAHIYGHVTAKKNGNPLPYINIYIKGTTIGTTTDSSGHYFLKNAPTGKLTIVAELMGYRTLQKEVEVTPGSTQELNFTMEEDDVALDEVVVSANRAETTRRMAPNLVSVIDSKLFSNTHAVCLAQGLDFQPGVRVEDNCQSCGYTQVRINGLDGHYSQILIDSRPIISALAGVYGLDQIPANMIQRVEVVRGGGSALFGGSAIGGTVNIITKEPTRNSAEFSHSLMSVGGTNAFDNNTTMNASVVTDDNRAGVYLFGQSRLRDGYDQNGDGYTELPVFKNKVIGLHSFLKPSAYSKLTLEYHAINGFTRGGNKLNLPPQEANIAEQAEHTINSGGLTYDLFSPNENNHLSTYFTVADVARNSYYGGTGDDSPESIADAQKDYGTTHELTMVGGAQYMHRFNRLLFMPSELTAGAEYSYDDLTDEYIGYNRDMKQKVRIGSAYLQNEWKNDRWGILLGGRLDKHNLINHVIFSPRINLRFNPTQEINLRASYAGGFRAPQTFDEDLHASLVGGERVVTRLAKNLKEERSNSLSVSADLYHTFGDVQVNFLLEGFYTNLSNVFAERKLEKPDDQGNKILERYNAYGAKVFGLNLEGKAAFTSWFQLQAGLTLQQSHYDEAIEWDEEAPKEKKMMRTPNTYGYFTATFNPMKHLSADFSGTYTGHMLVGHAAGSGVDKPIAVTTPKFLTFNLKLSYDMTLYKGVILQLNGGIQNLTNAYQKDFDKGWNRDSDYIYGPSLPRSFFIGASVSL